MVTDSVPDPPAKPTAGKGCLWAVGGLALLFAGCTVAAINAGDDAADDPEVRRANAEDACEGFVEDRLKAPATAEFSGTATTGSGSLFTVSGAVDAENSFGASLRSTYRCTVRLSADGSRWTLVSLTGLD